MDILSAILSPRLIKKRYTYPSENKRSDKGPLPAPIFNAILKVATIKLRNTAMTLPEFKAKLRQKFSSIKYKRKVNTSRICAVNQFLSYPSTSITYLERRPEGIAD